MKTIFFPFIGVITLMTALNAHANDNPEITGTTVVARTALEGGSINNMVVLNWSAKSLAGSNRFEIERSFYSNNFTVIATLQIPFTSNSNFRVNDTAAELAGRKIAYYRIKQVDANGNSTYSNTMVVDLQNDIQSTAIKRNTSINFTAAQNGNAVINLQSVTGQVATVKNCIVSRGNNTIELENMNGISKGIYTAVISVNGVVVNTQKVIAE